MRINVLGSVELLVEGQRCPLGSRKERCVLAMLAIEANQLIPIDTLMHRLWGDQLPEKARRNLYTYKTRLRGHVADATAGEARISTHAHGYVLETDPEAIDLHRFRRLRDQGVSLLGSDMPQEAADLLDQAAVLWSPEPLANLDGDWAEEARAHLNEERLAATHHRIDAHLRLSHHADLVKELNTLVEEHPFDEYLIGQLMRALHGSGRVKKALEIYLRERKRFLGELGIAPGQDLQELHRQMLSGEYETSRSHAAPVATPNNLLRDISDFTGRDQEVANILARLPEPDTDTTEPVLVISGMPGIGKTALATHLAHRLTERYPDGQLYLNLHAHDLQHGPLEPADALYSLLRMLDIPAAQIPSDIEQRASSWRSRMARRRAIVLLDNASGNEHVRHLLPGAGSCLVIITGRRRLSDLDESRSLTLDVLTDQDSTQLLTSIVDDTRTLDADATARLVRLCDGLPLAIRLIAGRLKSRPHITIADLAERMMRTGEKLKELHAGDRALRTAFETSYRDLPATHRRVFRSLSLHLGEEFTLNATMRLLDISRTQTSNVLDELIEQSLLDEPSRGLYRFHDLIREYAQERSLSEDAEQDRRACLHRLTSYYLALAQRANSHLQPYRHQGDPSAGVWTPAIATAAEAREQLELEISGILGAARQRYIEVPLLTHCLAHFLDVSGRWEDALQIHSKALEAWRARGDTRGEAEALLDLATVQIRTSRFDGALHSCTESLKLHQRLKDRRGEADAHDRLGLTLWHTAGYDEALRHLDAALGICREINYRRGEAEALMHGGFVLWQRGEYDACLKRFRSALVIYQAIDDRRKESEALVALGEVMRRVGRDEDALSFYNEATPLVESINDVRNRALLAENIAGIYYARGNLVDALNGYRKSLNLYREIGDRSDEIDVMDSIGTVLKSQGRLHEAFIHHQSALTLATETGESLKEGRAHRHMGEIELDMKRYGEALSHYSDALERAARYGEDVYELGCAQLGVGDALYHIQGHNAARPHWQKAADCLRALRVSEGRAAEARLMHPSETGT